MKKMIRLGLCLGLLSAALTCTALAATPNYTTDKDGTVTYQDGKYSASYSGTKTDNQYVLLVVKGTVDSDGVAHYSVEEDTIVYIDQQQATAAGVSFENWIPMSTPDCVVLLGGEFGDGRSPKVLGTLKGQGVTVSGSVALQGRTNYAGATVTLTGGTTTVTATTDSTGAYTLNSVPMGTYTLQITMPGYLSYTKNGLTVENATTVETKTLLAGDVIIDGQVTIRDLSAVLAEYGDVTQSSADLNGDGQVTVKDLSSLLGNYGQTSAVE